jgi:anaerobic ribonucleoside-triphosphate reductase activating protein
MLEIGVKQEEKKISQTDNFTKEYNMNILSTQYTLSNKALEIYVSGCRGNPHCTNCHNPSSWNFDLGEEYNDEYFSNNIKNKIEQFKDLIDNIMIFGGEPLDQELDELFFMLNDLRNCKIPIWIFTRYDLHEIPNYVKHTCDYIKCGKYDESLSTDTNIQYGIKLATSNQNIYKKGVDY